MVEAKNYISQVEELMDLKNCTIILSLGEFEFYTKDVHNSNRCRIAEKKLCFKTWTPIGLDVTRKEL